ncbi:MAG: hypothetical protein JJT96_13070 [Opitutales bacterium]|nr:hypothetical protein [Opitutales bacterium]
MNPASLSIVEYGALGDGRQDCTAALQRALDEAAAGSAARREVRLPPGVWLSGTLTLRSGITLHLERGATLRAIDDPARFPHIEHPTLSRMDLFPWRAFLFGHGLEDITLTGEGTIECGGEYGVFHDGVADSPDRPYGIHLVACRNVRLEGLRLRNAAHWMLRLLRCRDVTLRGLDIFNHANLNNDGLDIDSCDGVLVSDCRIDSSDDALCLKSETTEACRNVIVSNCLLSSHASAIKFGTASIGGFANVTIAQCAILPSRAETMHHPFNLPKGMTGIDVACVDGGPVEGLTFRDISMDGVLNPIFVKLGQRYSTGTIPQNRRSGDAKSAPSTLGKGTLRSLFFSGLQVRNAGPVASMIFGSMDHRIEDVTLRDVRIHLENTPAPGAATTTPDWSPTGYPCAVSVAGKEATPACGFHFRHIDGLVLDNVVVVPAPGETRESTELEGVERMERRGVPPPAP